MNTKEKLKVVGAFEIDRLGKLLAQIADLEAQADVIKNDLKEFGVCEVEGALFRATVSESSRTTLDPVKVKLALGDKISLCQKVSVSKFVRVVSK